MVSGLVQVTTPVVGSAVQFNRKRLRITGVNFTDDARSGLSLAGNPVVRKELSEPRYGI